MARFMYGGYVDYSDVGIIADADVHYLIRMHSRLIDRLNPAKMTEMSLLGQCILMGLYKNIDPADRTWMFYGKHSLYNKEDWG